jgi:hypothetical protein
MKVYGTQRDELNRRLQKLVALEPSEKEQDEVDRLRFTLEEFEKILGITMGGLENTIKELHSHKKYKIYP